MGCRAPRSGAPSPTPTTLLDTWLTGKRIGAYTFYTLDTVAHGAARRRLHLVHLGQTPRGPCGGGWPYAGTSAVRLLGDQSAATQVACAGPREALQNTPYSEQNFPTSQLLPLSRPAFRRTPLRQTGEGHTRMVLRRGLQFRNGATARAGATRRSLMRTSRPDSRTVAGQSENRQLLGGAKSFEKLNGRGPKSLEH